MKTALHFTCAYTKAEDVDRVRPCGRRATRRKGHEPNCLGHWAVKWIIGSSFHTRKTRAFVMMLLLVILASTPLGKLFGYGPQADFSTPVVLWASLPIPLVFGVWRSLDSESWLGGLTWLVATPLFCVSLVVDSFRRIPIVLDWVEYGLLDGWLLTEIVKVTSSLCGAVFAALWCAMFVLNYFRMYRWKAFAGVLANIMLFGIVGSAVAVAVLSGGRERATLILFAISLGASVMVGGTVGIKRLAQRMRF